MKFYKAVFDARPWYHDFKRLGIDTIFESLSSFFRAAIWFNKIFRLSDSKPFERGSYYKANQKNKEPIIRSYIQYALRNAATDHRSSFLELFCADGYYSFLAKKEFNKISAVGIDINAEDIRRCEIMRDLLGYRDMQFLRRDVYDFEEKFDAILCCGGLYHISNPEKLIEKCAVLAKQFLIIQTVVLNDSLIDFKFISPAPGWQHGCRFTVPWLESVLQKNGCEIVLKHMNELEGNTRPVDRYSVYYLCRTKAADLQLGQ
ncbi:MAG: methyltransferase domain-containing protein [bacterium]|nr:methyltransferase domain-containing protein [bacterium]